MLAFLAPENLHSGVWNSRGNYGRGRGVVVNTGALEGGHDQVVVRRDKGILLAADNMEERLSLARSTIGEQHI